MAFRPTEYYLTDALGTVMSSKAEYANIIASKRNATLVLRCRDYYDTRTSYLPFQTPWIMAQYTLQKLEQKE